MFEVRIFNPVVLEAYVVHSFPDCSESEAIIKAEEFLFSQGVKIGDLRRKGADNGLAIFGFRDQDSIASEAGGYSCVSNSVYFMFKYISEELGLKIDSFIDLGCGTGNILISARNLFGSSKLTGVEIDSSLVRQAEENTKDFAAGIILADLLEWKPAVNDYDLVYMYEPLRDEKPRAKFLANLKTWLKDGQYVYYQHIVGDLPGWLSEVKIPNLGHPCLFTFDKNKA